MNNWNIILVIFNTYTKEMIEMIGFINGYTIKNLRVKLLILYILNVLDIIFTMLLVNTDYFIEVNVFMARVVQNPIVCFTLKIIFVGFLLYFLNKRMKHATEKQLERSNIILNSILFIYSSINILHLFNICLFFSMRIFFCLI